MAEKRQGFFARLRRKKQKQTRETINYVDNSLNLNTPISQAEINARDYAQAAGGDLMAKFEKDYAKYKENAKRGQESAKAEKKPGFFASARGVLKNFAKRFKRAKAPATAELGDKNLKTSDSSVSPEELSSYAKAVRNVVDATLAYFNSQQKTEEQDKKGQGKTEKDDGKSMFDDWRSTPLVNLNQTMKAANKATKRKTAEASSKKPTVTNPQQAGKLDIHSILDESTLEPGDNKIPCTYQGRVYYLDPTKFVQYVDYTTETGKQQRDDLNAAIDERSKMLADYLSGLLNEAQAEAGAEVKTPEETVTPVLPAAEETPMLPAGENDTLAIASPEETLRLSAGQKTTPVLDSPEERVMLPAGESEEDVAEIVDVEPTGETPWVAREKKNSSRWSKTYIVNANQPNFNEKFDEKVKKDVSKSVMQACQEFVASVLNEYATDKAENWRDTDKKARKDASLNDLVDNAEAKTAISAKVCKALEVADGKEPKYSPEATLINNEIVCKLAKSVDKFKKENEAIGTSLTAFFEPENIQESSKVWEKYTTAVFRDYFTSLGEQIIGSSGSRKVQYEAGKELLKGSIKGRVAELFGDKSRNTDATQEKQQ